MRCSMCEYAVWLTQDHLASGDYRAIQAGQEICFPLEFCQRLSGPLPDGSQLLEPIGPGRYRFAGPLIYQHRQPWTEWKEIFSLFDFGLRIYRVDHSDVYLPMDVSIGSWWDGELSLLAGWYFYGRYNQFPNLPPAVYPWRVTCILRDETPLTTLLTPEGEPYRTKDQTRQAFQEVAETNDPGCDYLLRCQLLGPAGDNARRT
jgi:hypothetical protein